MLRVRLRCAGNETYSKDGPESKFEDLSLLVQGEGGCKSILGSGGRRSMWVTHPRHPAPDDASQVWPKSILDCLCTGLEGLVASLTHTIVIILV